MKLSAPEGKEFYPFQREGIHFMLGRKGTLLSDQMGLGKSAQAVGVINADPAIRRVLVICPASLKLNWRNEMQDWLTRSFAIFVSPVTVSGSAVPVYSDVIEIINYDVLHKWEVGSLVPPNGGIDLLILDEGHYIKNPQSRRAKEVRRIAKLAKRVVVITGTPIMNRPVELWPILQIVDPETWDPPGFVKGKRVGAGEGASFFRFAKTYCDAHQESYKTRQGERSHWVFSGASNLDRLQERLKSGCMIRRLKKDVLQDLPDKLRQIIVFEPPAVQRGKREVDDGDLFPDLSEATYERIVRQLRADKALMSEISKRRREQGIGKIPAVAEHIANLLDEVEKVVLFAHHHEVVDGLYEILKSFGCVVLDGRCNEKQRAAAVATFQEDPNCRIFLGSIGAASVGLTLTAASNVVFAELDWVPANMTQAEDRCHRIGQKNAVLVQHLVLDGSLDARMAKVVVKKQKIVNQALDVMPGTQLRLGEV